METKEVRSMFNVLSERKGFSRALGKVVYHNIIADKKSVYDVGDQVKRTLLECESDQEFEAAERMLEAITGYSVQNLLGQVNRKKEKDIAMRLVALSFDTNIYEFVDQEKEAADNINAIMENLQAGKYTKYSVFCDRIICDESLSKDIRSDALYVWKILNDITVEENE